MTDPLDDLKRAFERGTPAPDGGRRKANLARAMESWDRVGETAAGSRGTDGRRSAEAGIGDGVRGQIEARDGDVRRRRSTLAAIGLGLRELPATLISRPAIVAAAGLAAVGLATLFALLRLDTMPGPDNAPGADVVVVDAGVQAEQPPGRADESAMEGGDAGGLSGPAVRPAPESEALAQSEAAPRGATAPAPQPVLPALPAPVAEPALAKSGDFESLQGARAAEIRAEPGRAMAEIERSNRQPAGAGESAVMAEPVTVGSESAPVSALAPARRASAAEAEPLPVRERASPIYPSEIARHRVAAVERLRVLERDVSDGARVLPIHAGRAPDFAAPQRRNTEAFANEPASPVKTAGEAPVSTFSIDVDTASYSVVRSSLMNGYLPAADSVRIEEMVNYFPYAYPPPGERGAPFRPTVTVSGTPWNADTLLMHIGIQGRRPATDDRPPLNLVFLIDTSGSMDQPNKLPLLVQSFRLMVGQLDPADEVAIVTYAGSAGRVLDATPSTDRAAILAALGRLRAAGSTAGAAGIQLAYRTAAEMAAGGEVTRVILATDGDFNVGILDPEQLESFIARQREGGIYLSVLGFGRGNLDDATMQALAQNGNGQAAYIDTLAEAQKVLVDQLVGTLFPIANDVKIQVEFNPAAVAEYRLIGYETRALRREDFNNDRVDAGEVGAGHAVTAIYEVTPVGSPAVLHDALRYADRTVAPPVAGARPESSPELAFLRLRYKAPGEDASELIELPIARGMGPASSDQRFAAAVAGFGQLLRGSVYTGGWTWADAVALAEANIGDDPFGYRREAVTLMRLAESLAR